MGLPTPLKNAEAFRRIFQAARVSSRFDPGKSLIGGFIALPMRVGWRSPTFDHVNCEDGQPGNRIAPFLNLPI